MKSFKKINYVLFIGLILFNTQCKKNDLDFNKFKNGVNPEILSPLASTSITAGKILKQDNIIKYDPDGLIHLKFKQDSVFKLSGDSLLKDISLGKNIINMSMGAITFPSINEKSEVTLMELFGTTDNTQQALRIKQGSLDTFPSFNTSNSKPTNIAKSTSYEALKISKGYLVFDIKNNFPTNVSEIQITIIDNLPTPHTLGTAKFFNIPANSSGRDSINLEGVELSNDLSFITPVTNVDQSPSKVIIDTLSTITISAIGKNLICIGGRAVINSQTIKPQNLDLDLSDPSSDARLRNILFGSTNSNVPVIIESKFPTDVNLNVDFLDATISGNPISPFAINAVSKSTTNSNINFSNTNLFLGASAPKDYNTLRTKVSISIKASNGMVNFDSSDNIKMTLDASTAKFDYLDGYLGTRTFDININDLDVSQLSKLGKGIRMENPIMNIYVDNSFGVPILLKLDITAKDDKNNSLPMNVDSMQLPFPTIAQKGQIKSQTFSINKTNSNIVNCLGMPANTFNIIGKAIMNPKGFVNYNNHIVSSGSIVVGFDADIPMTFTAKDFTYIDTVENGETLQGKTNFDFLELKIKTNNGFPLDGSLDLIFTDDKYAKIDSLMNITLLTSGIPDANGRVITFSENMTTFLMKNSLLKKLDDQKCKYIMIRANFNTYNSGNVPVSIYTDSKLDVSIAFRGKIKI